MVIKKEKKNFLFTVIYEVFIIIVPLITSPLISRLFGPDGIGNYSYYFTIATYFTYFELLGVNNYGVRAIAKCKSQEEKNVVFSEIYKMQLIVSGVVVLVYLGFAFYDFSQSSLIALCFIPYVVSGALDINWLFFGLESFSTTTIRNIVVKSLSLVLIFVLIRTSSDFLLYILIVSFSYLLSQLIMWAGAVKKIKLVKTPIKDSFKHLKGLSFLFITVIAVSLYRLMDKIMLGQLSGMAQVGYYESAEKIVGVPGAMITALGTAMLPRMTDLLAKNDMDSFNKNFNKSLIFVQAIAYGSAFGLIGVSNLLIPLYFGEAFQPSSSVLCILGLSLLFSSWASVVRTQYLVPKARDKIYVSSVVIGGVVNISFNAFLIPLYGANGAAIGTVVAEAAVAFSQIIPIAKEKNVFIWVLVGLSFIVPSGLMILAIYLLSFSSMTGILLLSMDIIVGFVTFVLGSIPILFVFKKVGERKKYQQNEI